MQRNPQQAESKPLPTVRSWGSVLQQGGLGSGQPRDLGAEPQKVFVGDTITVTAEFPELDSAQRAAVKLAGAGAGAGDAGYTLSVPSWAGNKATWNLTPTSVGRLTTTFSAKSDLLPGAAMDLGQNHDNYVVVTDLLDFIMGVQAAQSQIIGKFAAASEKLALAVSAFRNAQADQDSALKDVGAAEKMVDDLLWNALFAAAGGGIGGAIVGGRLKPVLEQWMGKGSAGAEGFSDAAKDTIKFAVRSMDKMRGGSTTQTSGDSTSPPDPVAKSGGDRRAAGSNPLDFLTMSTAKIEGDKAKVQQKLSELIQEARAARAANSQADFDEDPMARATAESDLDAIISELKTDKKDYLKGLWRTWLATYGYKIGYIFGEDAYAESQVTEKLQEKINAAAQQCGEDGVQWVKEFSKPAEAKAEEDVRKFKKARGGG
jgi:hypothetical protein